LRKVTAMSEVVHVPRGLKVRRLHKAFLRYHDPNNWPMLRAALRRMGRADLIGPARHQLIPAYQPSGTGGFSEGVRGGSKRFRTQHTGLPDAPRGRATSGGAKRQGSASQPRSRGKAQRQHSGKSR